VRAGRETSIRAVGEAAESLPTVPESSAYKKVIYGRYLKGWILLRKNSPLTPKKFEESFFKG
jgi:hypothetical protein